MGKLPDYVSPLWGRHIGLLWFAVSLRLRWRLRWRLRRRLYHLVDKIPGKLLGLGLSILHIQVTGGRQ